MKNKSKNVLGIICLLLAVGSLTQPNFGFAPLDSAFSFGQNIVPTLAFVGSFWFIYDIIKNRNSKPKTETPTVENK